MLKVDMYGDVASYEVNAFVLPESEGHQGSVSGVFSEWFRERLRSVEPLRGRTVLSHREFITQEGGGISPEELAAYRARDMVNEAAHACLERAKAIKNTNHARIVLVIDVPTGEAFEQEEPLTAGQMEALVMRLASEIR